MDVSVLENQADVLFGNIAGWENSVIRRIGKRIGAIGEMSVADIKELNNIATVKQDMDEIIKELARVTGLNIRQIEQIYGDTLAEQHLENNPLYDFRSKEFVPFAQNKEMQAIVRAYAKTTGGTMINLAKTKGLCIMNEHGRPIGLQRFYTDALDRAVMQVSSGALDFHSAMRQTINALGGSGIRVDYGGGITRRLDTAVRQSLLWGAKQASNEYNEMIGEELGCDGIEIDYHRNPRPSHAFMQGKQYVLGKARTIKGIRFESADEPLARLNDYGCLHFKTPIICGISEPAYSDAELKRFQKEDAKEYTVDGRTQNGYAWSQDMRKLETYMREQKRIKVAAQASGDKVLVKKCNERIKVAQSKYEQISNVTGIRQDQSRTTIPRQPRTVKEGLTSNNSSGIIETYKSSGMMVYSDAVVTEETSKRVKDASAKVMRDIGGLVNYSEGIKFASLTDALGINSYNSKTGKNTTSLDRNSFADTKKLLEKLQEDFLNGKSYETDFIESLVAHELGHNAHIALALKRAGIPYGIPLNKLQSELLSKEYQSITFEIYEHCFGNESFDEIQNICVRQLGNCVYGNPNELIAQSFGNYYYGKTKSSVAKKIVEYFAKEMK